ncbi:hypothetical protein H5410_006166 [Solanum commersonii]|uniref:Uncharacterized protein n=1 Tax=Solanum commersonii TaxID=4109 RepID=A0A9J6A9F5_SOLCO|nr:hypothetical protein H5410_006166 [Solanum commersonii]
MNDIVKDAFKLCDPAFQGRSNENRKGKSKAKSKGKGKRKSNGKSTETSFASLIQSLVDIDLDPSYNKATLDVLAKGPNKGLVVMGVVRCLSMSMVFHYTMCSVTPMGTVLSF